MSNHEHNLMLGAAAAGAGQATTTLKRTLCVKIEGSPANLSLAGPLGAMWKAASGKETQVFSPTMDSEADQTDMVNSMRHGVIRRVSVEGYRNTFPFTLGVTMSCVQPTEVTELGEKFAYTVLPLSGSTVPQHVFVCEPAGQDDEVWRQNYSKWNKSNLQTEGVMDAVNQPFVFVHMSHPAIGLLKFNAPMIGCDIEKQPKIDGQYYKITRQVMNTCCQTLQKQILGRMKTQDLNMFSMQLHRPGAPSWDHLDSSVCMQGFKAKAKWTPEELAREKEHHLREFMTTSYQYIARVQIEYEVPHVGG